MVTSHETIDTLTSLLAQARGGDQQAYRRFLHAITPLLRRFIARRIPMAEVEDVVQETLISLHKAQHTYDGNRPLIPWLLAIARFRVTDALRKHYSAQGQNTVPLELIENILPDVTSAYGATEYTEELLDDLPERQQKILELLHVQGYTAKEVGHKMQMQESAVKVAAHRAYKKIREKYLRS